MYSHNTVKKILETAIDSLVDNFLRQPYIHRCEHSLHCELYSMLTVHRDLQGLYPLMGQKAHSTTLIHKEWPETESRPEKDGRRGNFDLVILNPEEVQKHTAEQFSEGRIQPAFVIEMGLNYGLEHLQNDYQKLDNSNCADFGYLVHFSQPHKRLPKIDVKKLHDFILKSKRFGLAAVVFTASGAMVKHLNDGNLAPVK